MTEANVDIPNDEAQGQPLLAEDVRGIVNEALDGHYQALRETFATRDEVDERIERARLAALQGARDYADSQLAKLRGEMTGMIEMLNRTLSSINETLQPLSTAISKAEGQLSSFNTMTGTLTERQNALSREQDHLRKEVARTRADIDRNQIDIGAHSSILTAHGQQMRGLEVALYGDSVRESLLATVIRRELEPILTDVAEVLSWKRAITGIGPRLAEALGDRTVRRTAAGAAGGIILTIIVRLILAFAGG